MPAYFAMENPGVEMRFEFGTPQEGREVVGMDSTILTVPPWDWRARNGQRWLDAPRLAVFLREVAERQASALGEKLHHAEFVVTPDPAVVEEWGMVHGCEECRRGTDEALRMLAQDPTQSLVVGMLYWAEPD